MGRRNMSRIHASRLAGVLFRLIKGLGRVAALETLRGVEGIGLKLLPAEADPTDGAGQSVFANRTSQIFTSP